MKKGILTIVLLATVCLSGCTDPQVAATTASLATWVTFTKDVQTELIKTANAGIAARKELDATIAKSKEVVILQPETVEALNQLRDKEGKIDWKSAAITLLLGGTVTNIFKNKYGKK